MFALALLHCQFPQGWIPCKSAPKIWSWWEGESISEIGRNRGKWKIHIKQTSIYFLQTLYLI